MSITATPTMFPLAPGSLDPRARRRKKRSATRSNGLQNYWAERDARTFESQHRRHAEVGFIQRLFNQRFRFRFSHALGDSQFTDQQVTGAIQHFLLPEGQRLVI